MEFCPKCGSILIQKKTRDGCPRCKYSSKGKIKLKTSEKLDEKKKIDVIKEKESVIHPIIEQECKECGNKKAYFWTLQTRSSDETETKFFKCTKCGLTWRDYH